MVMNDLELSSFKLYEYMYSQKTSSVKINLFLKLNSEVFMHMRFDKIFFSFLNYHRNNGTVQPLLSALETCLQSFLVDKLRILQVEGGGQIVPTI